MDVLHPVLPHGVAPFLQRGEGVGNVAAGPLDYEEAMGAEDVVEVGLRPDTRLRHCLQEVGSTEEHYSGWFTRSGGGG